MDDNKKTKSRLIEELQEMRRLVSDLTERKQMEENPGKARDKLEIRVNERTAELLMANMELMAEIRERITIEEAIKRSERRLKVLSQEFNTMLNALPDNLLLLSYDMKIIWANKAAAASFGNEGANLTGEDYFSLYGNPLRDHPSMKSFQTGREEFAEIADSEGRIWDIRSFPLKNESGRVKNVMELARDITRKVSMEKERKLIQSRLVQANKMTSLGTLVSGVAHEINNPNTYIKSNAQLLSKIWSSAEPILKKYHKINGDFMLAGLPYSEVRILAPKLFYGIDEGSVRIQMVIDKLRNFARPEKADLNGKVNVNDVVKTAGSILNSEIKQFTDKYKFTAAGNIPTVRGSAHQIKQVVINLIINSLQALKSKKNSVSVSTSYHGEKGLVVIRVTDEGHGMTAETLERITEPFYTTRLDSGGTGLGMSISYAIIKEHNGNLEFESRPGKGATVTVELPAYEGVQ